MVDFGEFSEYLKRYVQHHVEENPELAIYNGHVDIIQSELERLSLERKIVLTTQGSKQVIFVVSYFIDLFTESYTDLGRNFSIPFPNVNNIPKNVPVTILTKVDSRDFFEHALEKPANDDSILYCIQFSKNVPELILPSGVDVSVLINIALKKLQDLMRKNDSHDYFLRKLNNSNPGKEIAIRNFYTQFVAKPEEAWISLRTTGETYYYWNQLCYFIRQDYTKHKDLNTEDVNILQSVGIIDACSTYYKAKVSERIVRDAAFRQLDEQLQLPPYYTNVNDLRKMKDKNGAFLLGKYSDEELKAHISELTESTSGNTLPKVLIFKVEDEHYFIYKEKVMPLVVRLCNDARELIRKSLTDVWFKYMLEFETLPEMKESAAFEKCLERELRATSPILFGMLHASFLSVLFFDDTTPGRVPLFRDGFLLPYSEILLLSRQEIYADARMKLPVWYTMPLVSWIVSLFVRKPKSRIKRDSQRSATAMIIREENDENESKTDKLNSDDMLDPKKNRKREIRNAATLVEKEIVPETSTIDRELESYMHEWNDRIDDKAYSNLEEDINVLVRDYVRKILRSLKTENLTAERVSSLADSLVDTPSLMKIKNHPALKHYIELYIVKLLENLP